jgi:hypothetical protein
MKCVKNINSGKSVKSEENRVLTKRKENQLLIFERKVLRTISGPKIENGVYRRRYNHELDKEFNLPNALNVTKISRLRNAVHMIKMPENLPQKALSQTQWKVKSRKTEIQVSGFRDWTHCVQDSQT